MIHLDESRAAPVVTWILTSNVPTLDRPVAAADVLVSGCFRWLFVFWRNDIALVQAVKQFRFRFQQLMLDFRCWIVNRCVSR